MFQKKNLTLLGRSPRPRSYSQILKKQGFIKSTKRIVLPCFRVRDSSEKPATGVACGVQTWHATSLPAYSPTRSAGTRYKN